MTRARRVDNNHAEIVDGLRKCGMRVFSSAPLGKGFPDLVVQTQDGSVFLFEVKQPKETLTEAEIDFFYRWVSPFVQVIHSTEEALEKIREAA